MLDQDAIIVELQKQIDSLQAELDTERMWTNTYAKESRVHWEELIQTKRDFLKLLYASLEVKTSIVHMLSDLDMGEDYDLGVDRFFTTLREFTGEKCHDDS